MTFKPTARLLFGKTSQLEGLRFKLGGRVALDGSKGRYSIRPSGAGSGAGSGIGAGIIPGIA